MSECKCDMRTKLVGDGCRWCNPDYYIGVLEDQTTEQAEEIEQLQQQNAELRSYAKFWWRNWERVIEKRQAYDPGKEDGSAIYHIPMEIHYALFVHWQTPPACLHQEGSTGAASDLRAIADKLDELNQG